ncbi:MAG: hemerythrin domain-containing protein [Sphingomonadaceae bacterium]|nr:hemerythrin domain-containing protein [Sphingomonadaceae bacterium]
MSLERLIAEHDEIEALAALIERLAAAPLADAAAVASLLGALAIAIADHRGNEQRSVYLRLLNGRDSAASRLASSFADEYRGLEQDLEIYLSDWTAECIAADWETFGAETTAILTRMRHRVARESAVVYPLALQRGAVRLRAG